MEENKKINNLDEIYPSIEITAEQRETNEQALLRKIRTERLANEEKNHEFHTDEVLALWTVFWVAMINIAPLFTNIPVISLFAMIITLFSPIFIMLATYFAIRAIIELRRAREYYATKSRTPLLILLAIFIQLFVSIAL